MVLKKEIMKTQNKEFEKGGEYRQLLVQVRAPAQARFCAGSQVHDARRGAAQRSGRRGTTGAAGAGRACGVWWGLMGPRLGWCWVRLQALHGCAVKFPDVAANVVHLLMDFLGDSNTAGALDVAFFVREIVETNARLRPSILERLRDIFYQIRCATRRAACCAWALCWGAGQRQRPPSKCVRLGSAGWAAWWAQQQPASARLAGAARGAQPGGRLRCAFRVRRSSRVCTTALWILGEYSTTLEEIQTAIDALKQALGPLPLLALEGARRLAARAATSWGQLAAGAGPRRRASVEWRRLPAALEEGVARAGRC